MLKMSRVGPKAPTRLMEVDCAIDVNGDHPFTLPLHMELPVRSFGAYSSSFLVVMLP